MTWYGSFAGHGTLGDLQSVSVVVRHLVASGFAVKHATASNLEFDGADRVDWRSVDVRSVDAAVFVCGPVLNFHPETNALFDRLQSTKLVGVGVSLLPKEHPYHANPFDVVFARQGGDRAWGDLAILAPGNAVAKSASSVRTIGLCFRGMQSDYGEERCLAKETEFAVRTAIQDIPSANTTIIENHLARAQRSTMEIERQYASCQLVITTRFHGAISALRHGIPFIAIDQIIGGAKVYDLLAPLGWPHVHKIDVLRGDTLKTEARQLLQNWDASALAAAYNKAVREAQETLAGLTSALR